MKMNWVCGLFVTMALTVPASAQISIFIGVPPPPIRYEPPPPPPPPSLVWVPGFWMPQGHHYRWVVGHYDRPPYPGAHWVHSHYDRYPQGWQFHEGYWDHEDHEDHDHGHGHAYGHFKDKDDDGDQGHDHGHGH